MKIVSWNIHAIRGAGDERVSRISTAIRVQEPDVVLLQEVGEKGGLTRRLARALHDIGLTHTALHEDVPPKAKPYGNMIASRHPLRPRSWPPTRWPHLAIAADLDSPSGLVSLVSVHIPNGSGNGWQKIDAFENLADGLAALGLERPTIVGGDFNEPAAFMPDGGIVSWRWKLDGTLDGDFDDGINVGDSSYPRTRWQHGVEKLLAKGAPHGLRHAWFVAHPAAPTPVTHMTRARESPERFFDHILVSKQFAVSGAGFDHDVRVTNAHTSDHSLAWAEVRPQHA